MQAISIIPFLATIIFIIWGIFGVIFKKGKRIRRLKQTGLGFVACILSLGWFAYIEMTRLKSLPPEVRAEEERQRAEKQQAIKDAAIAEAAEAEKRRIEEEKAQAEAAAACLADLDCIWREQSVDIAVRCRIALQGLAKWDYEWTDSWTEPAFASRGWHNPEKGTIMAYGKTLKLQNGFGAWKRVSYLCAYDPSARQVVDATIVQ